MTELNTLNTDMNINKYDSAYIIRKGKLVIEGKTRNIVKIEMKGSKSNTSNSVHYINIVDTSGSMDMSMRYLKTAMKEFARGISSQDRMSVIQFNSPGKARVLLESVNLTDQSHLISYDTVIDKLEAYGTTCFSEPLELAKKLIEQSHVRDYLCVSIVTDGCSEGSFDKASEFDKCMVTGKQLGHLVTAINTIGCGEKCDVDFLKRLSSFSELGKYIHIDEVNNVREVFKSMREEMSSYNKNTLHISAKGSILYDNEFKTLLKSNSIELENMSNGDNTVYIVLEDNENTFSINHKNYSIDTITHRMSVSDINNLGLKWSKELHYNGEDYRAVKVLSSIGKDNIANELKQAVTEKEIKKAYEDIDAQVVEHHRELDLLSLLDRLKGNSYIDISTLAGYASNSIKEDRDNVETINNKYSVFNDYSINSLGTNLNISFKHKVKVHFDSEEVNNLKLDSILQDSLIVDSVKNYSVVKNCEYNISNLIMHVKTDVLGELLGELCMIDTPFKLIEYIKNSSIDNHKKVCFNLESLPIIGEVEDREFNSIYHKFVSLCRHKAIVKVLKYYTKYITDIFVNTFSDLDSKQIEFFKSNGLDSKMNYSDKVTSKSNSSSKLGITFSIKGATSMPSVDKVIDLLKNGKLSSKFYESIMLEVVQDCEYDIKNYSNEKCLEEWNSLLEFNNLRIKQLEQEINREKFERFMSGKYWLDYEESYGDYPTCKVSIMPKTQKAVAI